MVIDNDDLFWRDLRFEDAFEEPGEVVCLILGRNDDGGTDELFHCFIVSPSQTKSDLVRLGFMVQIISDGFQKLAGGFVPGKVFSICFCIPTEVGLKLPILH